MSPKPPKKINIKLDESQEEEFLSALSTLKNSLDNSIANHTHSMMMHVKRMRKVYTLLHHASMGLTIASLVLIVIHPNDFLVTASIINLLIMAIIIPCLRYDIRKANRRMDYLGRLELKRHAANEAFKERKEKIMSNLDNPKSTEDSPNV